MAVDVDHRGRQVQRDAEVVEALHHVAREPVGVGHELEHAHHLAALEHQAPGHDQPDVAGAEDRDAPAGQHALHVDELLRQPGGEHARRAACPGCGSRRGCARGSPWPAPPSGSRTSSRPRPLAHHAHGLGAARVHGHAVRRSSSGSTSTSRSMTWSKKRSAYSGPVSSSLK